MDIRKISSIFKRKELLAVAMDNYNIKYSDDELIQVLAMIHNKYKDIFDSEDSNEHVMRQIESHIVSVSKYDVVEMLVRLSKGLISPEEELWIITLRLEIYLEG